MRYCVICNATNGPGVYNREVVGVCRELNKPVCSKHERYCNEEGHGVNPLPKEEDEQEDNPNGR